ETPEASRFPEWVLQHVDQEWITGYPSSEETGMYRVSTPYLEWLLQRVGEGTGREFEILAEYMLSAMPGCRTYLRKRSYSTDYYVVCTVEGDVLDFRSELGRYFVTECKDWRRPVDVTAFAKFCRILDSVKSRFGIIFSRAGITGGEKRAQDAAREQLKVYQDRGMGIAVVTQADLERVATRGHFISMLRTKYEAVGLDFWPEARGQQRQAARGKSKGTRR